MGGSPEGGLALDQALVSVESASEIWLYHLFHNRHSRFMWGPATDGVPHSSSCSSHRISSVAQTPRRNQRRGDVEFRLVETCGIYYIFPEFSEIDDGKEAEQEGEEGASVAI